MYRMTKTPGTEQPVRIPWSVRVTRGFRQFIQFGLVGGSGTVVNLFVAYISKKIAEMQGISEHEPFFNLLGSEYNIRWYHVFATIAFLVANTWNYQLNRSWTFKGSVSRSWLRGYFPFLLSGIWAFIVSQIIITLLMNPTSPIALPADILDDSTGFRTMFYWAQAISIIAAMPINFLLNKLWVFRRPKIKVVADEAPQ